MHDVPRAHGDLERLREIRMAVILHRVEVIEIAVELVEANNATARPAIATENFRNKFMWYSLS